MDSTAIPWIILASVVVAAFSAIAAAISAYFSSRSSRTAADAAATTLILKFRDQYATDAMLIDLRNLRAWHDRHGSSKFAKTWQEKFEQKDVVCRSNLPSRTLRNALVAHHVSDRHLAECNYVSGKVGVRGNHDPHHAHPEGDQQHTIDDRDDLFPPPSTLQLVQLGGHDAQHHAMKSIQASLFILPFSPAST
jgi:hypothetical protein